MKNFNANLAFFFFLTIGFFEKQAYFSIFEIKIVCYEKF